MEKDVYLLKLNTVMERCGIKKTSVYTKMRKGTFPRPVKLGPNSIAWRSDEIESWIESRERL